MNTRKDLSFYSVEYPGFFEEYENILCVGWLAKNSTFPTGVVSDLALHNLKEIMFIPLANAKQKRNPEYPKIIIGEMSLRMISKPCPLCGEHVSLESSGVSYITGRHVKWLGVSNFKIPSNKRGIFYIVSSLIYHYIEEHNYLPPEEFLESLEAFDLTVPFDSREYLD